MLHTKLAAADGSALEFRQILLRFEHRSQIAALAVKLDGPLGIEGNERLLLALRPDEVGRLGDLGRRHPLRPADVGVLLDELVERTEVERPQGARRGAQGLKALLQTVDAHGALAHLLSRIVGSELRRAVGAGVVAFAASRALVLVDEHRSVGLLLVDRVLGAGGNARGLLAVSARVRKRMDADVRERTALPLVHGQPFLGARVDRVPILARDAACLAGVAAVLIEVESVLRHYRASFSPSALREAIAVAAPRMPERSASGP